MGALVGTICYANASEALDAYYSGKGPSLTPGDISYLSYFDKPSSEWLLVRKSIEANGYVNSLTSTTAPFVTFPGCDQESPFSDGVVIGWGIAAAMVTAWAFRLMMKAAK